MALVRAAGMSAAFFCVLVLSSCGGGFTAAERHAPAMADAQQLLYLVGQQAVSTYSVNPDDGDLALVSTVEVSSTPLRYGVTVFPSLNDRFLDLYSYDAANNQHISVFATDAHGAPRAPAIQTIDVPYWGQLAIPPEGKVAYMVEPTLDHRVFIGGGATIHLWPIDAATGRFSDTAAEVNDPAYPEGYVSLYRVSADGSVLYTQAAFGWCCVTFVSYLKHEMNFETGILGKPSDVYSYVELYQDAVTVGDKNVAVFSDSFLPSHRWLSVSSLQDSSVAPIYCYAAMSDACILAGDLQFDPSENFLFVTDLVRNSVRVLHIDNASHKLVDTGSSIPFTSDPPRLLFSEDAKLVYFISYYAAAKETEIDVFRFDSSSGALLPIGTSTRLPGLYGVVPAMRVGQIRENGGTGR